MVTRAALAPTRAVLLLLAVLACGADARAEETTVYADGLVLGACREPLQVTDADGTEQSLPAAGQVIPPGARIATGVGGLCVLVSPGGDRIVLDELSELAVAPAVDPARQDSLVLAKGQVQVQVQAGPVRVRAAQAVCVARGGVFRLVRHQEVVRVHVLDGQGHILPDGNNERSVPVAAGRMADLRDGVLRLADLNDRMRRNMEKVDDRAEAAPGRTLPARQVAAGFAGGGAPEAEALLRESIQRAALDRQGVPLLLDLDITPGRHTR